MSAASVVDGTQTPFPEASGRCLKIAVVDSGVNVRHPHITARTQGVVIGLDDEQSWDDKLGHGTAVMAAIQEKAPGAEYYAVRLFGSSLRTTTGRLIQAIEWAIENQMDIVNLSLGTPNLDYRGTLQSLVERAASTGIILVSPVHTNQHAVLPGSLDGVIGVDVDWDLPRNRYRIGSVDGRPRYFASGFPRSLPGIAPARNLNGISFATANMTGFVARACEGMGPRSFQSVSQALASEAD
jgi:subtilisin family serine protease